MTPGRNRLAEFLAAHPTIAKVEVAEARGSTPRERGAWMLASPTAIFDTIGGGQLEFMAIDRAREMLARGGESDRLDVPLGPEIGQCCGGRVLLEIGVVTEGMRNDLLLKAETDDDARPHAYLFGGGHVGHALAQALLLLPLRTIVVETRADALDGMQGVVETHLSAVPEEFVRAAPAGSAIVVLTHDHALDFLIVAEALQRQDIAYVGMIGSATKKATFKSWYLKTACGAEADFARLVTPIGGDRVKDKRPAVIASLAAAEIATALLT